MYVWQDFPKDRINAIREECGCNYAQQTRMELLELFEDAKDQRDIQYIFSMLDEAEELVETCQANARAQLKTELDACKKKESAKSNAEWEAWRTKWRKDMEAAKQKFMKSIG